MNWTLLLFSIGIVAGCILAMSVGVILRNRSFTSCGCASINFRGEKIRCPGCTETDEDSPHSTTPDRACGSGRPSETSPVTG